MRRRYPFQNSLPLALVVFVFGVSTASAESLFRAGISYQTSQPFTPRSLFSVPRPHAVGDTVTITINFNTITNIQNNSKISREQTLNENTSTKFNNIIKRLTGITQLFPKLDGVENEHEIKVTTQGQKNFVFRDTITCQVVEVLPNGFLVVQGKKSLNAGQEQNVLYLSGIVNPYFLNNQNTIDSNQVANLEMNVAQRGMFSRQQGDGVIGKYFQLFN